MSQCRERRHFHGYRPRPTGRSAYATAENPENHRSVPHRPLCSGCPPAFFTIGSAESPPIGPRNRAKGKPIGSWGIILRHISDVNPAKKRRFYIVCTTIGPFSVPVSPKPPRKTAPYSRSKCIHSEKKRRENRGKRLQSCHFLCGTVPISSIIGNKSSDSEKWKIFCATSRIAPVKMAQKSRKYLVREVKNDHFRKTR